MNMLSREVCKRFLRCTLARQIGRQSGNVSASEVNKFGMEAADWWEKSVNLLKFNEVRVPYICENTKQSVNVLSLKNISIIDVGCGGGFLSEALARMSATVTAIDPSPKMIASAKAHQALDPMIASNLTYENLAIDDIVEQKRQFDVVVASEVVEHVADLGDFFGKAVEVVKPGGSLFVTTLNRTTASYWLSIVLAEYVFRIVPFGTHDWEQYVTPEELQNILAKHKFKLQSLQGVTFNPCKGQWKYTSSTDVNYMAHFVKPK